jgi:hypothetical protein
MPNYPRVGNMHVALVEHRSPALNPMEKDHDHANQSSCHRHRCFEGHRRRLAKEGFTVVVNYAGNSASAAAVVGRIEAAGGRAVAAQADISDVAAVARMFDSAETAFGGVDVLINNAGIMIWRPSPTAVTHCSIATSRSISRARSICAASRLRMICAETRLDDNF